MEDLRERIRLLEDQQNILQQKQNEHERSMKKLREEIQQLIDDRREDLERFN